MDLKLLSLAIFTLFATFGSIETRRIDHTGNRSRSNGTSVIPYVTLRKSKDVFTGNHSTQSSRNRTVPHQPNCTDFWSISSPCRLPDLLERPIYPGPWWNQPNSNSRHVLPGHHRRRENHTHHGERHSNGTARRPYGTNRTFVPTHYWPHGHHEHHGGPRHHGQSFNQSSRPSHPPYPIPSFRIGQRNGTASGFFGTTINGTNGTFVSNHHGHRGHHGHHGQSFNQTTRPYPSFPGHREGQSNETDSRPFGTTVNGTNGTFIPGHHWHHGHHGHNGHHGHHGHHGEDRRSSNQSTSLYPSLSGLGEVQSNETASGFVGTAVQNGTSGAFIRAELRGNSSSPIV